mmetsp:Transcript_88500/g.286603  ORF Transcript_88500/g.286603 Transcript_88500/m.286603 type:complete len:217 (+) Transcript_88500:27-677(+)
MSTPHITSTYIHPGPLVTVGAIPIPTSGLGMVPRHSRTSGGSVPNGLSSLSRRRPTSSSTLWICTALCIKATTSMFRAFPFKRATPSMSSATVICSSPSSRKSKRRSASATSNSMAESHVCTLGISRTDLNSSLWMNPSQEVSASLKSRSILRVWLRMDRCLCTSINSSSDEATLKVSWRNTPVITTRTAKPTTSLYTRTMRPYHSLTFSTSVQQM